MRGYSKVLPQFWIGRTGRQIKALGIEARLIALYLISSPHANMIGVYYLPISLITHETDIPFKAASKTLQRLSEVGFCTYDEVMEYIWVHEMAFYQIGGQLKPNDNRVKNINDIYKSLPKIAFLPQFFEKYKDLYWLDNPLDKSNLAEAPSKTLLSQEQKQEQKQKQEKESASGKPDIVLPDDPEKKLKSQAQEILQFLNEKTGKTYRPAKANINLIIDRLKSGASVAQCFQIIAKKSRDWKSPSKMFDCLRPATLFEESKFEQYLGELISPTQSASE